MAAVVLFVTDVPRPPALALAFVAGLAALAAWALVSALWSPGVAAPVLELERGLLYVAATGAALLLLARGDALPALLGGIVAGAVLVTLYALATRLFPGKVGGAYDPSSGYQLAEPIGYWNALGLLTAIAVLLSAGLVAHGGVATRALAAVALVVLLPTLYFTFSRGALAALAGGALLQVALDPRRARLIAATLVTGAPAAAGAVYASRYHALTTAGDSLTTAQAEGRRVALALLVLALVAAAAAVAFELAERRIRFPARAGTALVAGVTFAALIVAAGALVAAGGPVDAVDRATASFRMPLVAGEGDLQRRLLSVSGNGRGDYWRVAWDAAREEPLLGVGAGGYEAEWLRERPVAVHARDAHNLYLETLAELGPIGLLLLAGTLVLPLWAAIRTRQTRLVAAAAGAYAAYLVHASVDWDWELPALAIPALFCAAAALTAGGADEPPWLTGRRRVLALGLVAPVVAVALVAHVGNRAAAASIAALETGDSERALTEARRAIRWAPWSDEAWQLRGEAELALRDDAAARRSLRRALELNPESWSAWLDLAVAGDAHAEQALERAKRLNPLSPEVEEVLTER